MSYSTDKRNVHLFYICCSYLLQEGFTIPFFCISSGNLFSLNQCFKKRRGDMFSKRNQLNIVFLTIIFHELTISLIHAKYMDIFVVFIESIELCQNSRIEQVFVNIVILSPITDLNKCPIGFVIFVGYS